MKNTIVNNKQNFTDYLPDGYAHVADGTDSGGYIKPSRLDEGAHKFRILQKPISGWEEWTPDVTDDLGQKIESGTPIRYREGNFPTTFIVPNKPPHRFWAFPVWSYDDARVCIMTVTQTRIFRGLITLGESADWGDYRKYDIEIQKIIDKKVQLKYQNKYSVSPIPPKPLSDDILRVVEDTPVNLDALFDLENPWAATSTTSVSLDVVKAKTSSELTSEEVVHLAGIFADFPHYEKIAFAELRDRCMDQYVMNVSKSLYDTIVDRVSAFTTEKRKDADRKNFSVPDPIGQSALSA